MTDKSIYKDVRPNLVVSDLQTSLGLYRDLLGFTVEAMMGEPPTFALLKKDGASVSLSEHSEVYDVGEAGVNMYINVTNVEELYEYCNAVGLDVVFDLTAHPWGMKDFVISDHDGHKMAFGEMQDQ